MTEHAPSDLAIAELQGLGLLPAPQRADTAVGPERHVSVFEAEIHGHPDSCCCHTPCRAPACYVPGPAIGRESGR